MEELKIDVNKLELPLLVCVQKVHLEMGLVLLHTI